MESSTTPDYNEHGQFLKSVVELVFKTIFNMNKNSKVIEWIEPDDLKKVLDLKINNEGETHQQLLKIIEDTLKYSVKTGHPYFLNQLFSG